jgi:hypothetical protein
VLSTGSSSKGRSHSPNSSVNGNLKRELFIQHLSCPSWRASLPSRNGLFPSYSHLSHTSCRHLPIVGFRSLQDGG